MTDELTLNTTYAPTGGVPLFLGSRRSGKSRMIVDWFLKDPVNRMVVTASEVHRRDVIRMARSMLREGQEYFLAYEKPPVHLQSEYHPRDNYWHIRAPYLIDRHIRSFRSDAFLGEESLEVMIDQADHLLQRLVGPHRLAGATWDH